MGEQTNDYYSSSSPSSSSSSSSQCPMPHAQYLTIRAILSLPAKIVAIVTELIWRSEN
ncbi:MULTISPECIES: hypothetical protein [unclassified Nostoc]|uniref:hypothetical protein n=1 Tax=unclassified Nostoc TaxID=2593658 RepID=UPI0025D56E9D|nr:hypothetical protein [Nostoc sp. NMS9]MBN3944834.1 hypothetical protein [Nostoc sp. NMS9]